MSSQKRTERLPLKALQSQFPPLPTTTRGAPTVLNVHEDKLVYCSGSVVVVRDLNAPHRDCLVYKGHNERTTVAAFSPNGYWIASADISGKIRVWSYDHPEHTLKLEQAIFAGEIKDICWGPESKRIVVSGDGRGQMIKAFTWDSGNSLGEFVGPQKCVLSVAYKPTRPYRILSASEDSNVCEFAGGPPFKFKQSLSQSHSNFVNCVRYSPDGTLAVSVGSDAQMVLYDGNTGELKDAFPQEHSSSIYCVAWSADGTQLLTSSGDKTVKLWDVASKRVLTTFRFAETPGLNDMQVSVAWSQSHMISLSLSGQLNYLSTTSPNQPIRVLQGHQTSVGAIGATHNALITGSVDGTMCIWSADGTPTNIRGDGHSAKITAIAAVGDDFVSAGWDDTIRFGTDNTYSAAQSSVNGQPNSVSLSSSSLVAVSSSKGLSLMKQGEILCELSDSTWTATCVAISPDGTRVAAGAEDHTIRLFNVVDGGKSLTSVAELVGHRGAVTCVAYSPDGLQLAAGDANREVRVWDMVSQKALVQALWVYHSTRVTCLSWHPSGKFVASGSSDEFIYLWNLDNPMKRSKFEYAHKNGVTGLAFTSASELASVGNDGCVCKWTISCV